MTGYEPGDVVLVPYPFGQRAGGRKRAALVISPTDFNETTSELIIAQITSRLSGGPRPGDYTIENWKDANLPRPAKVRCRLATLQSSLVLRRLGKLSEAEFSKVQSVLYIALGR
jgi:mRNA interferase MazF